jgi:hypothetical protein
MFFDARKRYGTSEFTYARSIAAQYGPGGRPVNLPKKPTPEQVQAAIDFRKAERAELEETKKQLKEAQDDAYVLAKHFLDMKSKK